MLKETFIARNHALKTGKLIVNRTSWYFKYWDCWDIWDVLPYSWEHFWYDRVRPFFKPKNKRLRNVIPKVWADISSLIENVNFEFIKQFYEEEYINGVVDWEQSGSEHILFSQWLEETYHYITVVRPDLEKQLQGSYPPTLPFDQMFIPCEPDKNGKVKMYKMAERGATYEELYGEVNRIESLIIERDTEVLTELVKRRQFFWT